MYLVGREDIQDYLSTNGGQAAADKYAQTLADLMEKTLALRRGTSTFQIVKH